MKIEITEEEWKEFSQSRTVEGVGGFFSILCGLLLFENSAFGGLVLTSFGSFLIGLACLPTFITNQINFPKKDPEKTTLENC